MQYSPRGFFNLHSYWLSPRTLALVEVLCLKLLKMALCVNKRNRETHNFSSKTDAKANTNLQAEARKDMLKQLLIENGAIQKKIDHSSKTRHNLG